MYIISRRQIGGQFKIFQLFWTNYDYYYANAMIPVKSYFFPDDYEFFNTQNFSKSDLSDMKKINP